VASELGGRFGIEGDGAAAGVALRRRESDTRLAAGELAVDPHRPTIQFGLAPP
jgi:hypothetical protein